MANQESIPALAGALRAAAATGLEVTLIAAPPAALGGDTFLSVAVLPAQNLVCCGIGIARSCVMTGSHFNVLNNCM